jgi:hypothetical protein
MKKYIQSMAIVIIALLSISTAFAQNPRLKSPLTVQDLGTQFRICYDISGLGNVNEVTIQLNYQADVSSVCFNRGRDAGPVPGQDQSFTQNPVSFTAPVHNGRARGCYTTETVFQPGACPNGFDRGEVSDVAFSNITFSILGETFSVND